ncbi:nickel pincer cofactor biosynthesis protein LarB [Thermococcus sp. LS2]|uniref:nickel pincer cofactor biosynthesis protein LarB n=1 Tax=Thermococcus sp. LS2 TaxID=1638260 RepID=UPI0014391BB7|nr:nickel pincer cofactor biosynthesis protein LarB [Thermococcus sp. LS2]NJE13154.1 nickel pincer cofactor biosynthesis protein LarB [Thermococcus sp. LS2]
MLEELLKSYKRGELNEEEVKEKILKLFYEESESFLLDLEREKRIGFPEVIFAEGKMTEHLLSIVGKVLEKKDIVFISNVDSEKENALRERFSKFEIKKAGRLMAIRKGKHIHRTLGTVGIITAGTSDIPYAEECALILEELGVRIIKSYDSGVAGIHRPFLSLKRMKEADLLIVFAGMEGVLPTLIASLTHLPIIAVPTPVGYGFGGKGEGALTTMLQSCVPGILVVNIGNTIGAAAGAIRILRAIRRDKIGEAGENKGSDQG